MTDRAALLAAILANPDDDTVRVVFADYLQEHGDDARAEFIRVQIELAHLPEPESKTFTPIGVTDPDDIERAQCVGCRRTTDCRFHVLRRRERELFAANGIHQAEWMGTGVHDLCRAGSPWLEHLAWFRRGFVHSVTCEAADWLANADAILAEHPVRRVRLTTPAAVRGPSFNSLRDWKKPLLAGASALWSFEAEWPGIVFEEPQHRGLVIEVTQDMITGAPFPIT